MNTKEKYVPKKKKKKRSFTLGTKILNQILIDKYKFHGDKRGLGYTSKIESAINGEMVFF